MSTKGKTKKTTKKRAQRATSNVFAMFDQAQIQEFKEAFNMIDQDRDGFISKTDLKDMYASLGRDESDDYLEEMIQDSPSEKINFTAYLSLFGEKLSGTDPEDVIRNAFSSFDKVGNGKLSEDVIKPILMNMGDRFTDEECEEMFRAANIQDNGEFDYLAFTKTIKHGSKDE